MGSSTSSLHEAVSDGNVKKLQRLLRKNARNINEKHDRGETLLLRAVKTNNPEVVSILLKYNADPNLKCRVHSSREHSSREDPMQYLVYDWTAMHEAARQDTRDSMDLLLAHGGDVNMYPTQSEIMPPLHIAAWYGKADVAQTMINAGCDVNQLDCYLESAIVIPICQGDTEMVELLLNAGCKLNSRAWGNLRKTMVSSGPQRRRECQIFDRPGPYSLLSLAIIKTWPHLAVLLLQHGYDPNKCEIYSLVKALRFSLQSLGDLARRVIACFLAAGHTPHRGDCQLMDNLQLPPNQGFDSESIEWIKAQFGIHSLKQLCRNTIRDHLKKLTQNGSIMLRLHQLSGVVPQCLIDYLTLAEFSTEQINSRSSSLMLL